MSLRPKPPATTQLAHVTTLGQHHTARTLVLRARSWGITVVHEHDRRLITRTHLLTLTGDHRTLLRFTRSWSWYLTGRMLRLTDQQLRARIREDRQRVAAHMDALRKEMEADSL